MFEYLHEVEGQVVCLVQTRVRDPIINNETSEHGGIPCSAKPYQVTHTLPTVDGSRGYCLLAISIAPEGIKLNHLVAFLPLFLIRYEDLTDQHYPSHNKTYLLHIYPIYVGEY